MPACMYTAIMLDYCRPQKPYKWYQIVQYVCGAVHKPMQAYAYPMATSYVMFPTHVQARAQESESTARSVAPPAGHSIASPTRDRRAAAQKLVVAEAAAAQLRQGPSARCSSGEIVVEPCHTLMHLHSRVLGFLGAPA